MGSTRGRFRVQPGELQCGMVTIARDQARHMRVMRLRPGDRVTVFDGQGREGLGVLEELDGEGAQVRVERVADCPEPTLSICLVQALPTKLPRMDTIVRQCTEVGVARIVPVIAERTRIPGGGTAVLQRRVERWRRVAEAASKQCGAATVPEVEVPRALDEIAFSTLPAPRLLLDPAAPAGALAACLGAAAPTRVTLFVGPEGGWSAVEAERLVGEGGAAVGLGPRVLRADTAGAVAAAVVQAFWGDLR